MAAKLPEVISETMTYTINIPTANLQFSTMANSQEVYQGVSKYDRQLKIAEVLISLKLGHVQLKFQP